MKFTVIRSRFFDLLSNLQGVAPARPALQIVSNVLLDAREDGTLLATATDLEVTVRIHLEADVKVDEPGQTTLPAKRVADLLRMSPEGEIQFDVNDEAMARVVTPAARYRLIGTDAKDYPVIPEPGEDAKTFTIDRAVFREMLRKIAYAKGSDETRRVLTGVLLQFADGKLTMVATDGRRMALVEQELEFAPDSACEAILPPKAAGELARLLVGEGPMKIHVQPKQIVFDSGNTRLHSKLIDGVFVRYQAIIPTTCDERVAVNREELLTALQRVSVVANDRSHAVRLSFEDGVLTFSANNVDAGEASDVLPIKYSGRPLAVTYNTSFLVDCLRNLDTDEVIFELSEGHTPTVLKCENVPFLYIIMPLRLPTA